MMLGATQGERVAPKYTDWSENDPFDTAEQQVFIRPLRTLEVIRQPRFSFAKVMKELSQEEDLIDNTWAYGKKYWSVEGPGQSRPATARSQKFKSAALNALSVVEEYSSTDDPEAKEVKITPDVDFTEYFDDGYDDELDVSIYAADIVKAVESSIVKKNEESLKGIMENMAVQFIGPVKTRELSERFLEVIKRSDRA
jgi:hypothetical protein